MIRINNVYMGKSDEMPKNPQPNSMYFKTDTGELVVSDKNKILSTIDSSPLKEHAIEITSFLAAELSNGDPCDPFANTGFEITLYHNGIGEYPQLGDIVYTDSLGTFTRTEPFAISTEGSVQGVSINGITGARVQTECEGGEVFL